MNLFDIKDPSIIKTMSIKEMEDLAKMIRSFLIENISRTVDIYPVIWVSWN